MSTPLKNSPYFTHPSLLALPSHPSTITRYVKGNLSDTFKSESPRSDQASCEEVLTSYQQAYMRYLISHKFMRLVFLTSPPFSQKIVSSKLNVWMSLNNPNVEGTDPLWPVSLDPSPSILSPTLLTAIDRASNTPHYQKHTCSVYPTEVGMQYYLRAYREYLDMSRIMKSTFLMSSSLTQDFCRTRFSKWMIDNNPWNEGINPLEVCSNTLGLDPRRPLITQPTLSSGTPTLEDLQYKLESYVPHHRARSSNVIPLLIDQGIPMDYLDFE